MFVHLRIAPVSAEIGYPYAMKESVIPGFIRKKYLRNVDPSWVSSFQRDVVFDEALRKHLGNFSSSYAPEQKNVFRVFQLAQQKVRLVVVGQDPYPQPGAATGRSFEVGNVLAWNQKYRQTSLRNIFIQYCKFAGGKVTNLETAKTYLAHHPDKLLSPPEFWEATESNGVMWLNKALTIDTTSKDLKGHIAVWTKFNQHVFRTLNSLPKVKFMIWGNKALEDCREVGISDSKMIVMPHPRVWSSQKGIDLSGLRELFEKAK